MSQSHNAGFRLQYEDDKDIYDYTEEAQRVQDSVNE